MLHNNFKKEIFEVIKHKLLNISLKEKKQMIFYTELKMNIYGTVSFGISSYGSNNSIFLNPVIGVFCKEVETIFWKITGLNTLKDFIPTISTPLGYLLPEKTYKEWEFSKGIENIPIIDDMISKISLSIFPFFTDKDSIEKVILEVERDNFILQLSKLYKLPLLYYINGEKEKGLDFINKNMKVDNAAYQDFMFKYKEL